MRIVCKKSKKSDSIYLVLVVNGVYVTFDRQVIEKVALTNGISNIDLGLMEENDFIDIKIK